MADDDALGELLVRENLISSQQLKKAIDFQESLGGDLRDVIVKLGFVKESVLSTVVATQQHVKAVEIHDSDIDDDLMKKIPVERVEQYQILILKGAGPNLPVAMADPNDVAAIEEVQFLTSRVVEPKVAPKSAIRKAINRYVQRQAGLESDDFIESTEDDLIGALRNASVEVLVRACLLTLVDKGVVSSDEVIGRLKKVE